MIVGMALSLTQLETFALLAQDAHFSRAAERLGLTQPAVTQQVASLQEHFGVKLAERVGRRTVLTDAGHFLAERSAVLIGNATALEREMREFADIRAGELRVGATVTIGTSMLPDLIARFRASFPAVRLRVEVENTAAMAAAVRAGRVSLALVEGPLSDTEDLVVEPYADDELVLIASRSHPIARHPRRLASAGLAGLPFVFREEGSGTRAQAERALRDAGIVPNVALTLASSEAIVRAVELDLGIAIVSRMAVTAALRAKRVVEVEISDLSLSRTLRIVRMRDRTPSPAALAFIAVVNEEARGGGRG